MEDRMLKVTWFMAGTVIGILTIALAFGSVPPHGTVTDDTALYQNLSEIRVAKEPIPSFDSDLTRLAQSEGRYQEKLPSLKDHPRLKGPLTRVSKQKYRYRAQRSK